MYEKNLIDWWNKNGFCGYKIETMEDVKLCLAFSSFKSISKMIKYHQEQPEIEYDYYKEIKDYGLESPEKIDFFLEHIRD
jgi:hypothetical protein